MKNHRRSAFCELVFVELLPTLPLEPQLPPTFFVPKHAPLFVAQDATGQQDDTTR
jgi:hypothetical protein